jgi:hypothetical protein
MFERIDRRIEALKKQIEAEKAAQAQPRDGLTKTTPVERHHARREEQRQIDDFKDTIPGPCRLQEVSCSRLPASVNTKE